MIIIHVHCIYDLLICVLKLQNLTWSFWCVVGFCKTAKDWFLLKCGSRCTGKRYRRCYRWCYRRCYRRCRGRCQGGNATCQKSPCECLRWKTGMFLSLHCVYFLSIVYFLAPLTRRSAQRSWWYYWFVRRPSSSVVRRRRPSVNFCFKSLLLLQFLFDHSEFFTGETRHIVPPCNKAGISNFCLELQKLQKFQISWKRYSSFSSYSIILKFILEKLGI